MALKHKILGAMGAVALSIACAPAAFAFTYVNTFPAGSANFPVTQNADGSISATIGNQGIGVGTFQDTFAFKVAFNGTGSGSISTSTSTLLSVTDLDITAAFVNGVAATITVLGGGLIEFASATGIALPKDPYINTIVIEGISRGNGSYGGNATFIPNAVPEAGTWAMMLIGFGAIGGTMRYRQRRDVKVSKVSFA